MIGLQELHLETGNRNSPYASRSPVANMDPSEEEQITSGLVAASNGEFEADNVTLTVSPAAENTTPRLPPGDRAFEPASCLVELINQPNPPRQPKFSPNLGRKVRNIGWVFRNIVRRLRNLGREVREFGIEHIMSVLGMIVTVIIGVVGINYANYHAEKSYNLTLYQTCRSYEVCSP